MFDIKVVRHVYTLMGVRNEEVGHFLLQCKWTKIPI